MATRILCLHGKGTNAAIFSIQTASFRSLLSSDREFVFVDGPVDCEAAPEIIDVYDGPYFCWYTSPSTSRVAAALEALEQAINEKGPFSVVMGFSQGAAIAASYLLQQQISGKPAPFKAAIFICSPIPFSCDLAHGIDTRRNFKVKDVNPARPKCAAGAPKHLVTDPAYLKGELDVGKDKEGAFYQMFHHTVDEERIKILTAHVFGKQDKWRLHSEDLYNLCQPEMAVVYEHDAGHEIPSAFQEEIADLVEGVLIECQS